MSTTSGLTMTAAQWATRIRSRMASTVESIVAVGVDLCAAKSQLGHGRFTTMVETDLGMDIRTAQRFMAIADHEVLANTTTWSHLPASYRALSELARLEPDVLERAIDVKQVNPETTTQQAAELVKSYRDRPAPKPKNEPPAPPSEDSSEDDAADAGVEDIEDREAPEVADGESPSPTPAEVVRCPNCGEVLP